MRCRFRVVRGRARGTSRTGTCPSEAASLWREEDGLLVPVCPGHEVASRHLDMSFATADPDELLAFEVMSS